MHRTDVTEPIALFIYSKDQRGRQFRVIAAIVVSRGVALGVVTHWEIRRLGVASSNPDYLFSLKYFHGLR